MESNQTFKKLTYDDLKLIHDIMPKPRPKTYWEFLYDKLQKYLPGCIMCRYKHENLIRIQIIYNRREVWCQFTDETVNAEDLNGPLSDEIKLHATIIAKKIVDEYLSHGPNLQPRYTLPRYGTGRHGRRDLPPQAGSRSPVQQ